MPPSKHGDDDFQRELQAAIDLVVQSNHPKKIVVAGPGAGKTSLFKTLLSKSKEADKDASHLVVTLSVPSATRASSQPINGSVKTAPLLGVVASCLSNMLTGKLRTYRS